jgi:hypothetical protein
MSQRDIESLLGRLLTDSAFRVRFFSRPAETAAREGLGMTPRELKQLERVPVSAVLELASHIDPTLRRFEPPESGR